MRSLLQSDSAWPALATRDWKQEKYSRNQEVNPTSDNYGDCLIRVDPFSSEPPLTFSEDGRGLQSVLRSGARACPNLDAPRRREQTLFQTGEPIVNDRQSKRN